MEKTYEQRMKEAGNLRLVTIEEEVPNGALIGFCASNDGRITASYPVWSKYKDSKVLMFMIRNRENPIIDNTSIREEQCEFSAWVNEPPIIVETIKNNPKSFQSAVIQAFGG